MQVQVDNLLEGKDDDILSIIAPVEEYHVNALQTKACSVLDGVSQIIRDGSFSLESIGHNFVSKIKSRFAEVNGTDCYLAHLGAQFDNETNVEKDVIEVVRRMNAVATGSALSRYLTSKNQTLGTAFNKKDVTLCLFLLSLIRAASKHSAITCPVNGMKFSTMVARFLTAPN